MPEQWRSVKSDRLGRAQHPRGCRLAHAVAGVKHAIDCGDTDAGGAREIVYGWTTVQTRLRRA